MYDSYEPWNVHASLLSGTPGLSMQYILKCVLLMISTIISSSDVQIQWLDLESKFRIHTELLNSEVAWFRKNADIQISAISALKMFVDSRYCRCQYKYRHTLICQQWKFQFLTRPEIDKKHSLANSRTKRVRRSNREDNISSAKPNLIQSWEGIGCQVAAPNRDKVIFNVCLWQPNLTTNVIWLSASHLQSEYFPFSIQSVYSRM